ncbi:MAG: hypothetical protein IKI19_00465, partial [Prevotella sp.]|nr:hypothetical protein [Prevotella sp.]
LGVTNNKGAVDENYRYLMSVSEMQGLKDAELTPEELDEQWAQQLDRLAALSHHYPVNTRLILKAATVSDDPFLIDRMVAAAGIYMDPDIDTLYTVNVIPWMTGPEWPALKDAILRDSALIHEAGRLTGVEPRLIVGCLIGEQIRLFNSKREMFKKYLGPVKVLSVQSQFSYGVNGIKDFTAAAVEEHLQDPTSEYYMGPAYEHLLDFTTDDHETERYNRLVDYRNHLYSYIYTGCILHQTMLQWRRAGYDISDRPDILFTLFNVGFSQSVPKPDPMPGGSHITVGDREYTFGAIGFDFYYSGELAEAFPFRRHRFIDSDHALTPEEIERIQDNMSDCKRPEKGLEYRKDSTLNPQHPSYEEAPDPFGIDHSKVVPTEHTAQ